MRFNALKYDAVIGFEGRNLYDRTLYSSGYGAIWTDENRFNTWLKVEILATEAQCKLGVVPEQALAEIKANAGFDVNRINVIEAEVQHDVIAFLTSVREFVGDSAKYIHLGMTSSDVIDTSLSSVLRQSADILIDESVRLEQALEKQAKAHKYTVMMGRSHGVHAEPVTLGLKLALWLEETRRNTERLRRAREVISVGKISGAVGTFSNIDPWVEEYVCEKMGLTPAPVSTQIVQRDRHAEFMTMLALCAASLEKFATEIRHLQRTEVREIEEPFGEKQKGSSAMPHKRNPVVCERICGLARVIRGNAMTALENVALWHERDISHSSAERIILPDACIALDYMLDKFTWVIENMQVYPKRMLENIQLTKGLVFSQHVLLALIEKGMMREEAYRIVQKNAMRTWQEGIEFRTLIEAEPEVSSRFTTEEITELFKSDFFLGNIDKIYARVGI